MADQKPEAESVTRRKVDNREPIPLSPGDTFRIILADAPGPGGCMIEIENEQGQNIRPGVLYQRSDGKWEIELKVGRE